MLVHDGILWLAHPIQITDMFIHRIKKFPYKGADPAKKFAGKTREKELANKMKKEYGLVKKSWGYSIMSVQDLAV